MKKPRDIVATPNGDWQYTQPETGKPFKHSNPSVLFSQIWSHRMALPDLGMDVSGGWKERLWHDICRQNEYLLCDDTEDKGTWVGMGDIWRYLHTLGDLVLSDKKTVSQEEAERRANVCLTGAKGHPCPNNQAVSGCFGCRGAGKVIESITGKKKTSKDNLLHACTACGCLLRIKIHLPLDAIHTDESKLPSFCWQRRSVAFPIEAS